MAGNYALKESEAERIWKRWKVIFDEKPSAGISKKPIKGQPASIHDKKISMNKQNPSLPHELQNAPTIVTCEWLQPRSRPLLRQFAVAPQLS